MAKAVRWQIPFQSLKGVNYRIDIYDNYTGSVPSTWPIQLEPGESPITTEDEADDNFFCPVRPTTGTIQVVDRDGTLAEQIMPANNTERPVKLYSIANNVATIEWQGFLSCEVMEQSYQSTAQVLDLNIIGMLEAMDSMQYEFEDLDGFITIRDAISKALKAVRTKAGRLSNNSYLMTFGNVYYPVASKSILTKYINPYTLVSVDEQATDSGVDYINNGESFKSILEMICTYIGWCVREVGNDIYFTSCGNQTNDIKYCSAKETFSSFIGTTHTVNEVNFTDIDLGNNDIIYRGTGHQRSFMQGAKAVEVVTNLSQYNIECKLPECPVYDLVEKTFTVNSGFGWRPTMQVNMNHTFNSLLSFQASELDIYIAPYSTDDDHISLTGMRNITDTINSYLREDFRENFDIYAHVPGGIVCNNAHMMAFLAKYNYNNNVKDVLCILGFRYTTAFEGHEYSETSNTYLFKMKSSRYYIVTSGSGNLKIKWHDLTIDEYGSPSLQSLGQYTMSLKFGNKYWNPSGQVWQTGFCAFMQMIVDEEGNLITDSTIPINSNLQGKLELAIYRKTGWGLNNCALFTELSVSFEENNDYLSSRDQNRYIQLLGLDFKDQETIQCHLSSDLFNRASPSIICDDEYGVTPMKNITYYVGNSYERHELTRRPEKDLLARMALYYNRVRRKLSLETEHPTQANVPMLTITGYDDKKYKALAESRDWQQDTSTITCFETPDGDE